MVTQKQILLIQEKARIIRHHIVDMIGCEDGKVGHLGGSSSASDIVSALYFYKMNIKSIKDPQRDWFLLSKGHAVLAQYAALAEMGAFPVEELTKVKCCGAILQGHPDKNLTPGIEANTGSLGQGLSIALGIALGLSLDKIKSKVYVMMGDGEQSEGQIWEAAMAASYYRVDNLVGIIDRNRLQAMGKISERFNSGDLIAKWSAFGWHTIEIDGHNVSQICDSLDKADHIKEMPVIIIANTTKGKCITFAEDKAEFHNAGLTTEQYKRAHEDIDVYEAQ